MNAGLEGGIVVEKVKALKGNQGFNAATEEYEDMLKAGIIDPTKVTRSALQNAASVAGLLLTTEVMVAEIPTKRRTRHARRRHGRYGRYGRHGRHDVATLHQRSETTRGSLRAAPFYFPDFLCQPCENSEHALKWIPAMVIP